jgi:predicted RNA binding protein YcfA (HicA-like mRNA interferase family)
VAAQFPSLKAQRLLAVLKREPLAYEVVRQKGSHRTMRSPNGYGQLLFSYHEGATVPPGAVRKIMVKDVGLDEETALGLLR